MTLPAIIGATIETAFAYAKEELLAPGGGAVGGIIAKHIAKQVAEVREVALSELQRIGATSEDFADAEQFAAGAFRLTRAVRDQTAAENIRLLIQAMVGLARREKLWASEFLKYADILAGLSKDEIILIGAVMAEDKKFFSVPRPPNNEASVWKPALDAVVDTGGGGGFPSVAYASAIAARAQRSGLIIAMSVWGGTAYALSPIGREVREFVDIEAALNPRRAT